METVHLETFRTDTELTNYMPLPRQILDMDLSATAVLLYGVLLDRGTLSQKNAYADDTGWVYVIYPIEGLAQTLHISDTAVKRHLRQLQDRGLILRRREDQRGPSHIHVRLPGSSIRQLRTETKCTDQGPETPSGTGRKVPPNNRRQQHKMSNYYQHREDESLLNLLKEQRLYDKRLEAFGDAAALYHYRFQNDNGTVPQMKQASHYEEHWNQMFEKNLGLLFWGKPGNGKTFAAGCIANALLESEGFHSPSVKMTTLASILARLPGMSAQDKEWYLEGFRNCGLLILDDFGMERQTEYAMEQVFQIINGRYLARRPLIVTTNLSLQELKHPADMARQRIYDRVLELCVPVCFDGDSLRQEKAKENMQLYRTITGQSGHHPGPAA